MDSDIRAIKPEKMETYDIQVLPNGLPVCKIKLINFSDKSESIECDALIDTGASLTIICESIFNKFNTRKDQRLPSGISTLNANSDAFAYPLLIHVPSNNWSFNPINVTVTNLADKREYKAIVGVDVLSKYFLFYDGVNRTARLQC